MAYFRISELAPGVVPVPAAALIEVSVPDGSTTSGYDSHRVSVSEFFTDIVLGGAATAPTQPPGSNNNFIATTEYVDYAVAAGVAAAPYVELAGDTMTGDLYTPRVRVTGEYWFQDRTGAEQWALYTEGGSTRLYTNGGDQFTVNDIGDAVVSRNLTVNGAATINSYVTVGDFRSNANVYAPNGFGYFGTNVEVGLNVLAHGGFFTASSLDAGPSTSSGSFTGRRWRFKQDAGDDGAAGAIDYRGYDNTALSIVGAAAAGGARRVTIYDFLNVSGGGYYGGQLGINDSILFHRAGQSSTLLLFDDGNGHIEGTTRLWIQSSGQPTEFGGSVTIAENEPLTLFAPTGGNARIWSHVNGVRLWSFGGRSDGSWGVGDENAGALRFYIDTAGSAYFTGYTTVANFRSNDSVYVPNGYGYFGTYVHAHHTTATTIAGYFSTRDGIGDTGISINNSRREWEVGVRASFPIVDSYVIVDRTANKAVFWADTSGYCWSWAGDWGTASDRSLKQDVEPYTRGLDAVRKLNPISYRYISGTPFASEDEPSTPRRGLMVDEVLPHLPEICGETQMTVGGETKDVGVLFAGGLIYAVINSLKEIADRLEVVEAAVAPATQH